MYESADLILKQLSCIRNYTHREISWVTVKDFATFDPEYIQEYITQEGLRNSASNLIPKGTLITSTRMALGKAVIYDVDVSINQDLKAIFPVKNRIATDYFYYWFQYNEDKISALGSGSTVKGISLGDLKKINIPLPPTLAEQQAIATALSDVDELIHSLDGLIQKKEAIKKGTMQQLLTGNKRLPGFDGEWQVKALGDVCDIISGGTPSTRNSNYWDGNIKWCTPTDITRTKYKYINKTTRNISIEGLRNSSATLLPKGSLLLCSRATVGDVKIATDEIFTNQGFKSLICSDCVNNEFLYYLINLEKQKFIDKAFGSTFLEISKKNTTSISFNFPEIEEQKAIAQILSDMDEELQALRHKREKMVRVKEGMMQELLTGKTRLV